MKHILNVLVQDRSGVLVRVAGLFSRRGYNINSLTVGSTENPGVSCMTIVVEGDDRIIEQVTKQLHKVVEVLNIGAQDSIKMVLATKPASPSKAEQP